MATDLGVGDSDLPFLVVSPADTDTDAILTVYAPDGTSSTVPVSGGPLDPIPDSTDLQQTWTADEPVTFTAPGRWVLHWDVTGTGEGAEDFEVFVVSSPVAGGPTWWPGLTQVATHVPYLTVDTTTPGSQVYLGTFSQITTPTDQDAWRHITNAAGLTLLPGLTEPLYPAAQAVVALRAAASLARAYPRRPEDFQFAAALDARADAEYKLLRDAITDLADGDGDGFFDVAPVWTFPPAPCWGPNSF